MSSSTQTNRLGEGRAQVVLFAALAGAFALGMTLAWLPLRATVSRFGFEDAFYYLRVARSIVEGTGPAFDGIHPTNGFHPLWMVISVVLVAPFRAGSEIPVHLLFSLCVMFHILTAYVIYRLVVSRGGHANLAAALLAAFLWLFNYNIAGIAMCGLETSMFAFLVVTTVYLYVAQREELSARQSAKTGLMVGLTALARFDGALLGFALAADQLYAAFRRKEPLPRIFGRVAPMSLIGSALMVPWMLWSYRVSGTIFPNSQRALKLWVGADVRFAHGLLKGLFDAFAAYAPEMAKIYGLAPMSLLSVLLVGVFCAVLVWKHSETAAGLPALIFVIYPIAHTLYYAVNFAPLNRYLYPAHLLAFAGMLAAVGCRFPEGRSGGSVRLVRILAVAACAIVVINVSLSSAKTWRDATAAVKTNSLHWTMYSKVVPWIKENVPQEERIGAFNCGIYGYFSGRTAVNLDGVINDSVIPALENRRLIPYLYQEKVRYVIDWETMLDFGLGQYGGVPDYREKFKVVKVFEQPWGPYKGERLLVLRLKEKA